MVFGVTVHGLYAHPEKCLFHSDTVKYLGYILSPDGLKMSDNKVKIIKDWPETKKVKDIQLFLGFANFYHHFINKFSDVIVLLTCLMCKGISWDFSDKCCKAFQTLKKAFISAPLLSYWIPDAQLIDCRN